MGATRIERPHLVVTDSLRDRLYGRCQKVESGCWLWVGSINPNGYGKIKINGIAVDVHVISWRVANAGVPVPAGSVVMHLCDVRNCINPDHLQVGTQSENMLHAIQVGAAKVRRGGELPHAVLDESIVRQIRSMYRPRRFGYVRIAKALGLNQGCVDAVLRGRTWKHVD